MPNGAYLDAAGVTTSSFGPIANTVRAAAAGLDAMAGTSRFAVATDRTRGRLPVRLTLTAPLGVPVDAEPRKAAVRAAEALAWLGHDVREHTPDWDDERFRRAWMTALTALLQQLIPALERLHGRPLDRDALEPATRAWLVDSEPVSAADRAEALDLLAAYARRVQRDWPRDGVLVTPTLTRLPVAVQQLSARPGVTADAVRFSALTRVWNVTGQPAISLPVGSGGTAVQLVGPPGRDDLVLSLAAQLEEALA